MADKDESSPVQTESATVGDSREFLEPSAPDSEAPTVLVLDKEESLQKPELETTVVVSEVVGGGKTSSSLDDAFAAELKSKTVEEKIMPQSLVSFKEESNRVGDLQDFERKALQELKQLVEEALNNRCFSSVTPEIEALKAKETLGKEPEKSEKEEAAKAPTPREEISIWGVPLLVDDRTDVILLKFLRARDFKIKDAFVMIQNTIKWRKDFGIDLLLSENLGDDLDKAVYMQGHDKEGHPVCYNIFGEFQNRDLYKKTFSDEEKRTKFLRWRIQFLERSVRKLDYSPGGISTIFQVTDLKNSPGLGKKELRLALKMALQVFQDNYPEFIAKQVYINVPWWYLAFYSMMSPFLTERSKSKFVFARPARSAETLFKYISPEQIPIQYGGLSVDSCDCNPEFELSDQITDITVKPLTKQTVEIIIYEKCIIVWELRVVGWEVSYGAEFVPSNEEAYTLILQKPTKMAPTDEPVISRSFKVSELGKLLLIINNPTSKKKKLLYRFKVKPFVE